MVLYIGSFTTWYIDNAGVSLPKYIRLSRELRAKYANVYNYTCVWDRCLDSSVSFGHNDKAFAVLQALKVSLVLQVYLATNPTLSLNVVCFHACMYQYRIAQP